MFDYIRRAMPWPNQRTLADDAVYALTAYILALNKIIDDKEVMHAETLPKVKMPNRDNFIIRFPERIQAETFRMPHAQPQGRCRQRT